MWKPAITKSPLYENLSNVENPFDGLDISDSSFLDEKQSRENCSQCGRSRMWFCYECRLPLASLAGQFPQVKLPFMIDIIKHERELNGKSTGVQASILSDQVNIFTYPNIPAYADTDKVLLIFPCKEQFDDVCLQRSSEVSIDERCGLCDGRHMKFAFDRVILVDSTWCQTKRILLDDRIATLPHRAGLTGRESVFWRPQRGRNLEHLSTVEALHEICRRWLLIQKCPQSSKVDNILFFFRYFHNKIANRYKALIEKTEQN